MPAKNVSTVLQFVTTTPEEIEEMTTRWLNLQITIALLKHLKSKPDGGISEATFKRAVKAVAKHMGFKKDSIFYPTEFL